MSLCCSLERLAKEPELLVEDQKQLRRQQQARCCSDQLTTRAAWADKQGSSTCCITYQAMQRLFECHLQRACCAVDSLPQKPIPEARLLTQQSHQQHETFRQPCLGCGHGCDIDFAALQETAVTQYRAFIQAADGLGAVAAELAAAEASLDALLADAPALEAAAEGFSKAATALLAARAQNKQLHSAPPSPVPSDCASAHGVAESCEPRRQNLPGTAWAPLPEHHLHPSMQKAGDP